MYKKVLLKISGESLKEDGTLILSAPFVDGLTNVIKTLHEKGIEVGVVTGAGNIFRGKVARENNIDQISGDYMGMYGTIINALGIASNLRNKGVDAVVFSSFPGIKGIIEDYSPKAAKKALKDGKVCFYAAGIGKPFFTTDTAATLRGIETGVEAILVGKYGVEGLYDDDPRINKDAKFIKNITYDEILKRNLLIMDISAVELIKDKNIEMRIFNINDISNFVKVCDGEDIGSICHKGE